MMKNSAVKIALGLSLILMSGCSKDENVQTDHLSGLKAFEQGDWQGALVKTNQFLKAQPQDAQALTLLGKIHLQLMGPDKAQAVLLQAHELGSLDAYPYYIESLYQQSAYTEIVKQSEKIQSFQYATLQDRSLSLSYLGMAYFLQDQPTSANKILKKIENLQGESKSLSMLSAMYYFYENEYSTGMSILKKQLAQEPHDHEILYLLATGYKIEKDLEAALKIYQAIAENSLRGSYRSQHALMQQALIHLMNLNHDAAVDLANSLVPDDDYRYFSSYILGLSAYLNEDYALAQTYLLRAASLAPEHAQVHYYLASTLIQQQQIADAKDICLHFLEHQPFDPYIGGLVAMIALHDGDVLEAHDVLAQVASSELPYLKNVQNLIDLKMANMEAIKAWPKQVDMYKPILSVSEDASGFPYEFKNQQFANIEQLLLQSSQYPYFSFIKQVEQDFGAIFENEFDISAYEGALEQVENIKGILSIIKEDYIEAIVQFSLGFKFSQNNDLAGLFLAAIAEKNKDYQRAINYYRGLIKQRPDNAVVYEKLADILISFNNVSQTKVVLENGIAASGDNIRLRYLLAKKLIEKDLKSQALAVLNTPERLHYRSETYWHLLAQLQVWNNHVDQAEATYQKLLNITQDKDSDGLQDLFGSIEHKKGNYAVSIDVYQKLFAASSKSKYLLKLSESLFANEQKIEAKEKLKNWLLDHPLDVNVKRLYANYLLQDDDRRMAIREYQELLQLLPNDTGVLNNLAWLLKDKDPMNAIDYALKAQKLDPESAEIQHTLEEIRKAI